jgi:dimethylamine monooxygenase subunit A
MKKRIYLPFADAQWRLKMGLKPLQLSEWIEIDEEFKMYLDRKAALLQNRHADVFASLPTSQAGQQEVLDELLQFLPQQFPAQFQKKGNQIYNLATEQVWQIDAFADRPLDLAGRLVQEDLCLMQPSLAGYVLTAGSVCFPFHWRLPEKLGQPLVQIHQPVPNYADTLARPVNQVFDRLRADSPCCRFNWGIVDTPELCLAYLPTVSAPPLTIENAGAQLWIRVERQTLRRFPRSNAILFTIRTYRYPLAIVEQQPSLAQPLMTAMQQMPSAMQRYKNFAVIQPVLLPYLSQIAAMAAIEG